MPVRWPLMIQPDIPDPLPIDSQIGRAEALGRGGVLHILDDEAVRVTQPRLIARGRGRPFLQHLSAKRHQMPRNTIDIGDEDGRGKARAPPRRRR
jgi:hypothetical protein